MSGGLKLRHARQLTPNIVIALFAITEEAQMLCRHAVLQSLVLNPSEFTCTRDDYKLRAETSSVPAASRQLKEMFARKHSPFQHRRRQYLSNHIMLAVCHRRLGRAPTEAGVTSR